MDTHFGQWLKLKFEETGYPTYLLAKKFGISEPTVYRWCQQASPRIRAYHLTHLAEGLGIPRRDLVEKLNESRRAAQAA